MQNENIMSVNNAPQAFRGPVREPMAQINFGLEEDIYGNQVDHFLRKNTDMPSMAKPHNAFIDQLEAGLPMGGLADDKQLHQSNFTHSAAPDDFNKAHHHLTAISHYSQKENDSNLAPAFRPCENFNERHEFGQGAAPFQ